MNTDSRRNWVRPVLVAGLTLVSLAVAAAVYLLDPQIAMLVRTGSTALSTEEVASARIFLGTWGRQSVVTAFLLAAWQAIAVPLPHVALVRAAADIFGPFAGALSTWAGMVFGSLVTFGIARGLFGGPIAHLRSRRAPLAPAGANHARLLLALRLIPLVPQDVLSIAFGVTRMSWRAYAAITAVTTIPTVVFYTTFAEDVPGIALQVYTLLSIASALAVLGWFAWQRREHISAVRLTATQRRQLVAAAVMATVAGVAYLFVPGVREGVATASDVLGRGDIEYVRDYLLGFGAWAPIVSAVLMVFQSVAAPLPAFVVTFANGLLFGWVAGAALSWSSAMAGAALCFWLARSLGRPAVEKLAGGSASLEVSDLFFERYGYRAVLIARLLPFVSFDIISYGAGLTSMGFWRFFVATGLGQLPATLVYSYLGQNLTGSVRVLFLIFLFTTVVFVAGSAARPYFMTRLRARQEREAEAKPDSGAGTAGEACS